MSDYAPSALVRYDRIRVPNLSHRHTGRSDRQRTAELAARFREN
jgi:hypothetical protein